MLTTCFVCVPFVLHTCTGSYCSEGQEGFAAYCAPGYYCPQNSTTAFAVPCPAGFRRVDPGAAAASDCTLCPAGNYCPRGSVLGLTCPAGSYCSAGRPSPIPCPKGTYGNRTALVAVNDCWPCDGGTYCDQDGLSSPSGKCDPGFYCTLGSQTSQPSSTSGTGGPCPPGGYCPQGSFASVACPAGRYQNVSGASDMTLCTLCPPVS